MDHKDKLLDLWQGDFGDKYRLRNPITEKDLSSRKNMWSNILTASASMGVNSLPTSFLEVGAGQGINLLAINSLYKLITIDPDMYIIEPNIKTKAQCYENCLEHGFKIGFLNSDTSNINHPSHSIDMVFTSGVLIHINPDNLIDTMREMYRVSKKYIVCIEYFSAEPREHTYHDKVSLFTRDFGSMWLDNFPLKCLAVGFMWKRVTGLDNLTYWVFEKVN